MAQREEPHGGLVHVETFVVEHAPGIGSSRSALLAAQRSRTRTLVSTTNAISLRASSSKRIAINRPHA